MDKVFNNDKDGLGIIKERDYYKSRCAQLEGVSVAGDRLPTSNEQFEQRAKVLLADEQAKINPDNALIGFICDAVRLSRENIRLATAPIRVSQDGEETL